MALILTETDVRRVLPMGDLIDAMTDALAQFSSGRVQQPVRTVLPIAERTAFFGIMPAYVSSFPAMGTKVVTVFPTNTDAGLPTHLATILLFDPQTGALMAMLDAHLASRPFMAGERFTMADIPIGCEVHRWFGLPPAEYRHPTWPHLERWFAEVQARPGARGVLDLPLE